MSKDHIHIQGARQNNLKGLDLRLPLNQLIVVTGVSGSGKSTLVQDICFRALRKLKARPVESPGRHRAIRGHEHIADVVLVDQSPIGKTTRSNPARYVGHWDPCARPSPPNPWRASAATPPAPLASIPARAAVRPAGATVSSMWRCSS
jgi:excinuclease UvrABC ATPase subunit